MQTHDPPAITSPEVSVLPNPVPGVGLQSSVTRVDSVGQTVPPVRGKERKLSATDVILAMLVT